MRGETSALFLEVGQLLLQFPEPLFRRLVTFPPQRLPLDLELHDPSFELVELGRHRVDFHAQFRRRLVHEVDRFVGQEPVRDVAVGQDGGGHQRAILDLHPVMELVTLAQTAQDADRVLDGRLADHDGLEPPLERGVLLDVLPVLVERRRADGVKLAPGQHRLQHVRRVHRPFRRARADHGVQLVDEEDHLALCVGDLLEDGLQTLFELAAVFRSRDEGSHVERDDAFVLQAFRHVAAENPAGEAFDDGRLADARLADEHRIVLGAARQHLDDTADFFIAADDRIQLALLRELGEVAAVPLERLIRAFRVLVRHALRAPHAGQRMKDRIAGHSLLLQERK